MANKSDVFQRLHGLETEYALVVPPESEPGRRGRYGLFRDLVAALRRRLPAVPARHMKEGVFHAAGGAVWFETERPAVGGGLIEGSTPECRSPRQVVAWQRAQDELLAEAVAEASGGIVRLVKNDRDAQGNIYGAQESYEAVFATGWRLWLWRLAIVAMTPLGLVTWLVLWIIDKCVILYALAATLVYLVGERFVPRPEWLSRALFGCDLKDIDGESPTGPVWLEIVAVVAHPRHHRAARRAGVCGFVAHRVLPPAPPDAAVFDQPADHRRQRADRRATAISNSPTRPRP